MINIERALKIPGWMRESELRWLAQSATWARRILEIGSWKGRSTRALGDHCRGTVYTVDCWKDPEEDKDQTNPELQERGVAAIRAEWRANLKDLLASKRVVLINKRSPAARAVKEYASEFDLIFIDGDHSEKGCREDIEAYLPLLKRGGVISGHDYGERIHPGVKLAVDAIFGGQVHRVRKTIWWVAR